MEQQHPLVRAARAFTDKAALDAEAPPATDKEISDLLPYIRAAFDAVREPSEDMCWAGAEAFIEGSSITQLWQAMLDEVINASPRIAKP